LYPFNKLRVQNDVIQRHYSSTLFN